MNPTQRHANAEQRRQQIAALYLQGHYQSAIAQQVGVSQQQVSYDLKALQKTWLASALRDFDTLKAEQLAKIDAVERAAWEAWARSLKAREITVQETIAGERQTTKASIRNETQVGDPRFLERIQKCIDQRCDILGLSTATEAAKVVSTGLAALLVQAKGTVPLATPLAEA
jgi:hypothetical protein